MIELLVVISVIALLTALLLPGLSRARNHARTVVCRSKLRQLGLTFWMYVQDNDGRVPGEEINLIWRLMTQPNFKEYPDLALCPSATRPLPGKPISHGDTFHAFSFLLGTADSRGSYGFNRWICERSGGGGGRPAYWGTCNAKHAGRIPVASDCSVDAVMPKHFEPPPDAEGLISDACPQMCRLCIDRHNGGINMLFMDWSVRKVGLKELWTLKWHRQFDTAGPWTRAGGVESEDWPEWMRKFKDY